MNKTCFLTGEPLRFRGNVFRPALGFLAEMAYLALSKARTNKTGETTEMIPTQIHFEYRLGSRKYRLFRALESRIDAPGVKIRFDITGESPSGHWTLRLFPERPLEIIRLDLIIPQNFSGEDRFLINGYQSWTESRELGKDDRLPGLNRWLKPFYHRYRLERYGDYFFYPYANRKGIFHSYTFTYIRQGRQLRFWGSLEEDSGFTIFRFQTAQNVLLVQKDCSGLLIDREYQGGSVFWKQGPLPEVFHSWFRMKGLPPPRTPEVSGWTSWYHYYTDIDEAIIRENLQAFARKKLPVRIFQIDDGWQQAVGDWHANEKFSGGMRALAAEIHSAKMQAGLWLAPFICAEKSRLRREHPEWLRRDERGRPVIAGFNPGWGGAFYALDTAHPGVRAHLRAVFHTVLAEWRFDMVKLDFLYAAALHPPKNQTRGQVMGAAMQFLRDICGGKQILGCGVPLGSAFGRVDFCRIGGDVALQWEDWRLARLVRYRERVSTAASLRSTVFRHPLHRHAFLNDPDVFLLRRRRIAMNAHERHTLFVLNLLFGGVFFTSDNIAEYDSDTLRRYQSQFPLRERRITSVTDSAGLLRVRFVSGAREYVVWANLSEREQTTARPGGIIFSRGQFLTGSISLAPHQTRCFLLAKNQTPALLGSTGHLFPGMEVDDLHTINKEIILKISPNMINSSTIFLRVPAGLPEVSINGQRVQVEMLQGQPTVRYHWAGAPNVPE